MTSFYLPLFLSSPTKVHAVFSSSDSSPQPEKINLEDLTGELQGILNYEYFMVPLFKPKIFSVFYVRQENRFVSSFLLGDP